MLKILQIPWQTGFINNFCQLVDPEGVRQELSQMKSLDIDGIVVECWWGIVEAWSPQKYVWSGYRELFNIIREFKLKLQVMHSKIASLSLCAFYLCWILFWYQKPVVFIILMLASHQVAN